MSSPLISLQRPSTTRTNGQRCASLSGLVVFDLYPPIGFQSPLRGHLLTHPRSHSENSDQCQLGQPNSNGQLVRKPAQLVASDQQLMSFFKDLRCGKRPSRRNGRRAHLTGKEAHSVRTWPWIFAQRLVRGVVRLMKEKHWQRQQQRQRNNNTVAY